jgi:hypothetical protein
MSVPPIVVKRCLKNWRQPVRLPLRVADFRSRSWAWPTSGLAAGGAGGGRCGTRRISTLATMAQEVHAASSHGGKYVSLTCTINATSRASSTPCTGN